MKVIALGTAAGGGFPQWNCACEMCRRPDLPARTQDSLAVSANGRDWYLLNVSPDIRQQVLAQPFLHPGPGPRETPLRGALLTDAELDHTIGLLMLREGAGFQVWAPDNVHTALRKGFPVAPIVSRYHDWMWHVVGTERFTVGSLACTTLPIGVKRPKYASDGAGPWSVAYRIEDPATGGVLVYAPCLGELSADFEAFAQYADVVILDGTFYSAGEMSGATGADGTAQRAMSHLPVSGPGGSLARKPPVRWYYTHLNNTNPMLDAHSPASAALAKAGAEVLADGQVLDL